MAVASVALTWFKASGVTSFLFIAEMASEEPVMLESYVVDAGRKCKIRCCSRDHVILFVQG